MFKNTKNKLLFFGLLLFLFLGANFVYALEVKYPRIPGFPDVLPPQDFIETAPAQEIPSFYVRYIFALALWLGFIIAVGALIYGGILYIISYLPWFGKPEGIISARKQITAAFLGILILFTSYLILYTINPQLTILKFGVPKRLTPIIKKYIPPPEIEAVSSAIYVELPFARIIERIFETYISDIPAPSEPRKTRMEEIKENALNTLSIAQKIKGQSEELQKLTENYCYCDNTNPTNGDCTCDPCSTIVDEDEEKTARDKIQEIEKENLKDIGIKFKEIDSRGEEVDVGPNIPNLKEEREKILTQIKELKIELERLETVEGFIKKCPNVSKKSYAQFLSIKGTEGEIRKIKFWDDISMGYRNREGEEGSDWATFLCLIGGTKLSGISPEDLKEEGPEEEAKATGEGTCSTEVPVGEIIDRAKRITRLLIEKLEGTNKLKGLVQLNQEVIDAVDRLDVSISKCSSKNCTIAYDNDDSKYCEGSPCPFREISREVDNIREISEEIEDLVKKPMPETKKIEEKEEVGIVLLIDVRSLIDIRYPKSVVSELIRDLDQIEQLAKIQEEEQKVIKMGTRGIRYPLQICTPEPSKYNEDLFTCRQSVGKIGPESKGIGTCCMEEWLFQDCLEKCYLEKGQKKYRECLQKCLEEKAKEAERAGVRRPEEIGRCHHLLNFFCCSE